MEKNKFRREFGALPSNVLQISLYQFFSHALMIFGSLHVINHSDEHRKKVINEKINNKHAMDSAGHRKMN